MLIFGSPASSTQKTPENSVRLRGRPKKARPGWSVQLRWLPEGRRGTAGEAGIVWNRMESATFTDFQGEKRAKRILGFLLEASHSRSFLHVTTDFPMRKVCFPVSGFPANDQSTWWTCGPFPKSSDQAPTDQPPQARSSIPAQSGATWEPRNGSLAELSQHTKRPKMGQQKTVTQYCGGNQVAHCCYF